MIVLDGNAIAGTLAEHFGGGSDERDRLLPYCSARAQIGEPPA
jgi:hypothetical protein